MDLIYIDPPFDSKADYKKKIQLRGEQLRNNSTAFEEKQYSDIWNNDEYLQFIYERLILIRETLSSRGIVFFHCDPARGHYLKCVMDEIFGQDNFINQIVWKRSDAHNDVGQGAKHLGTIHDMILLYSKTDNYTWNMQFNALPTSTIENWYRNIEPETGRRYNKADVTGPGGATKGNPVYEWKGVTRAWRYSKERMLELDNSGKLVYSGSGMPYQKRYLDESKGIALQDWWDDIQMIRGIQRRQEAAYPTEKPEDLLERIINLTTNPGDLVFDCFMGSGTTQAVAMKLGRRFLGADINLGAIQTTTKRLIKVANELNGIVNDGPVYTGFQIYNVNHYDVFRNPLEAKELLMKALEIESAPNGGLFDGEQDGWLVKIMPVNRIATRADLNELLSNIDLRAYEKKKGETPNRPVDRIKLVCMGHEPDLAAQLRNEIKTMGYSVDVEVVDVLRDRSKLEFKRDAEAEISIENNQILVREFYPMNLLQKLSLMTEDVGNWKELVESILIDWNYDGAVLEPTTIDIPEGNNLVRGVYPIPANHGTIRVKITDLLSESLEQTVTIY